MHRNAFVLNEILERKKNVCLSKHTTHSHTHTLISTRTQFAMPHNVLPYFSIIILSFFRCCCCCCCRYEYHCINIFSSYLVIYTILLPFYGHAHLMIVLLFVWCQIGLLFIFLLFFVFFFCLIPCDYLLLLLYYNLNCNFI